MADFLFGDGLTPHGFCLAWNPGLFWLQATADLLIGLAYFWIPFALIRFLGRRPNTEFSKLFWLFSAFILSCGTTHFMSILTLWVPAYWPEGGVKAITAALSLATAGLIWPMLEAAERSEGRFRLLAANAADVLFELDRALQATYVSPAGADMVGYKSAEFDAMPAGTLVHPDDREHVIAGYRAALAGTSPPPLTYRVCGRDGKLIWVETVLRPLWSYRRLPKGVIGVARDVTLRKTAEDRLRESESRYRMLADSMTEAVACFDHDLHRTYASPSFQRLLGYRTEELVGRSAETLAHPQDWPELQSLLLAVLAGEEAEPAVYRIRHKNGTWIWGEVEARLMADGSGVITSLRDVTRRKLAEDQLLAANAQLEALARTDELTGLANRRCFEEALESDFRRCTRAGSPLSLIMVDVDRFKLFNDRYGHQAGDDCLRAVGEEAKKWARRPGDLPARYGGEELAVLLPDTPNADAAALAEEICRSVKRLAIPHADNDSGVVTASFGVATCYPSRGLEQPLDLVRRADAQLYAAKTRGRDRVMVDTAEP